nr:MAG TPA: hypothetical protein [Bacteriophage sp.]
MIYFVLSYGYTLLIHFCVRRRFAWGLCCCQWCWAVLALPRYPARQPTPGGKRGRMLPFVSPPNFRKTKKTLTIILTYQKCCDILK